MAEVRKYTDEHLDILVRVLLENPNLTTDDLVATLQKPDYWGMAIEKKRLTSLISSNDRMRNRFDEKTLELVRGNLKTANWTARYPSKKEPRKQADFSGFSSMARSLALSVRK